VKALSGVLLITAALIAKLTANDENLLDIFRQSLAGSSASLDGILEDRFGPDGLCQTPRRFNSSRMRAAAAKSVGPARKRSRGRILFLAFS
jgi:hypothetical protein